MIEGLDEWEEEEAARRAASFNAESMREAIRRDNLKDNVMTEEELKAEAEAAADEDEDNPIDGD